jgi:hypothetical protein
MLDLSNVTLLSLTTVDYAGVRAAIERCLRHARFHEVIVFTDKPSEFPTYSTLHIPRITSPKETSVHLLCTFPAFRHRFADFTLTVHWDSWIVRPEAWTDENYEFDYIGARWPCGVVGNDGFGWKSRRFWDAVSSLGIPPTVEACWPADVTVCRQSFPEQPTLTCYRSTLESMGVRYATAEIADRFSTEDRPYTGSFGFHGRYLLPQIVQWGLT